MVGVCRELDDLMIRVLELMEEQITCKLKLQETIKSSCLDLAKARYIMGNHSVSYLQLPSEDNAEITALRTVTSSIETKKNLEHTVFELHSINPEKISLGKQEEESSLRRRAGKDDDDDDDDDERKENDDVNHKEGEENGRIVTATDPLKWFGYLVPQNLRQAQKGFQTALELVIQSANIQSELEATCKRCDKLLKLKTTLTTIKS